MSAGAPSPRKAPPRMKPAAAPSPWDLAAAPLAGKIRGIGLPVGFVAVHLRDHAPESLPVPNAILSLGALYTLLDTWHSLRGRVLLGRQPLAISALEALFVALLCYFDGGLESPFRFFYFLSLICCAERHPSTLSLLTCALHVVSYCMHFIDVRTA